jgi:hypothetical protein
LQRKQSRLLPESHHQGWALAHPLERATSMDAQLGGGTELDHFRTFDGTVAVPGLSRRRDAIATRFRIDGSHLL